MSKYYIARNKDNSLFIFEEKPYKYDDFWCATDNYPKGISNSLFPEVKWEDKEPKVITIEESPWIKFEDRFPDVGDKVLVMYNNIVIYKVYYLPLIFNNWDDVCEYNICGYKAIAWMHIPEFKK